jgi:hypothetical protein
MVDISKLEIGTFIVLINTNYKKATGIVLNDPCYQKYVKYVDEDGISGHAYDTHIKAFAEITVNWEEGLND